MTSFRISVTVLAVIHAVFAGFTALVGAFANGGDVWQRLLVVLLHPLGAAGLLLLVLRPRLATTKILAMMALLTANVIADLWVAQMISAGSVRGRSWLFVCGQYRVLRATRSGANLFLSFLDRIAPLSGVVARPGANR